MNPSPELRIFGPEATSHEGAAVIAAVEQFRMDNAPVSAPEAAEQRLSQWKEAALLEGVSRHPDQ